eukprot:TRINITY_DN2789_c0_g1_i11.p1 TRINITY_DN2789_c0_g1~~TRINITY_DN2789_c0_g1_i11.p1  ORF type:complete len:277 (-),score=13.66 TRINITY_DN2789_c0_g1_i11:3-833(-)
MQENLNTLPSQISHLGVTDAASIPRPHVYASPIPRSLDTLECEIADNIPVQAHNSLIDLSFDGNEDSHLPSPDICLDLDILLECDPISSSPRDLDDPNLLATSFRGRVSISPFRPKSHSKQTRLLEPSIDVDTEPWLDGHPIVSLPQSLSSRSVTAEAPPSEAGKLAQSSVDALPPKKSILSSHRPVSKMRKTDRPLPQRSTRLSKHYLDDGSERSLPAFSATDDCTPTAKVLLRFCGVVRGPRGTRPVGYNNRAIKGKECIHIQNETDLRSRSSR